MHRTSGARVIQHDVRLLRLPHEHDLGIAAQQLAQPPPLDGIGHPEVDPELHAARARTRASTAVIGTASASPPTVIVLTPTTRPSISAIGPPELPGASRRSA